MRKLGLQFLNERYPVKFSAYSNIYKCDVLPGDSFLFERRSLAISLINCRGRLKSHCHHWRPLPASTAMATSTTIVSIAAMTATVTAIASLNNDCDGPNMASFGGPLNIASNGTHTNTRDTGHRQRQTVSLLMSQSVDRKKRQTIWILWYYCGLIGELDF